MNDYIDGITFLIKYLPEKDVSLGETFLKTRDFLSLKELVDSALYKLKKQKEESGLLDDNEAEIYEDNLLGLEELKNNIDSYLRFFQIEEDYSDSSESEIEAYLYSYE